MYDRVFTDRIPDLTERYPEGFGGVDMFEPRDPEYEFWCAVEEAERAEREALSKDTTCWVVSFYLHGDRHVVTYDVPNCSLAYYWLEGKLKDEYGEAFKEIDDFYPLSKTDETKDWWVSFSLQDGTQTGMSPIAIPVDIDPYIYIENLLIKEYGDDYADIADCGCWDDMEDDV